MSPTFVRVTFEGPELANFPAHGFDDQVKIALVDPCDAPLAGAGTGWYRVWRADAQARGIPIRTYTVSRVRPEQSQIDVVLVAHAGGCIGRWATSISGGERLVLVGSDASWVGAPPSVKFRPREGQGVLIVGDETAVPAVESICRSLTPAARGSVVLEVPHAADRRDLDLPPGLTTRWLVRSERRGLSVPASAVVEEARSLRPNTDRVKPGPYCWVAAEAAHVRKIRRLLRELWAEPAEGYFSAYWRAGFEGS